ncbi:MAG: hypothetical protein HY219_00215, partial [Candidatus Staskawiczbacteria bacterium]|nr:hypothetical protein [Candidatus Staskawiczbacteria bacterium]
DPLGTVIPAGQYKIKVCAGDTSNICDTSDNYFTVYPACKYISVLDDNHDNMVTRGEGEAVTARVQAAIGAKTGDANFVPAYDINGNGAISSLDSLILINDLLVCAPITPVASNNNDQFLASISDAIARIAEAIKEMFKK